MTTDTKARLTDLLKRKAKASSVTKAEFVKWLDDVRALVRQFKVWLGELEGLVTVTDDAEEVAFVPSGERAVRRYQIPLMRIEAGDGSTVEVRPILSLGVNRGAFRVAGADGRVDLVRGARLVTILRDATGGWSILRERSPRVVRVELDEESFMEAMRSLLE